MMKKKSETKIKVDQIYVTNNADLYLITSPTTNGCKLSAINTSNTYNLLLHYIPATAQNGVVNQELFYINSKSILKMVVRFTTFLIFLPK